MGHQCKPRCPARVMAGSEGVDDREALTELLGGVEPWDGIEADHVAFAQGWVAGGAELYRAGRPDNPAVHLVSYFVPFDEESGRLLLTAHRKSGLWLPPGGHVEPGETPWEATFRETAEELGIVATPWPGCGTVPLFVTATMTRGPAPHTDVSLWHVIAASPDDIDGFDEREFEAVRWVGLSEACAEPEESTDPHLARFSAKLEHARRDAPRGSLRRATTTARRK